MNRLEKKAIRGARNRLNTFDAPGGLVGIEATQLISARFDEPRQWLMTLQCPSKEKGSTPWVNNLDNYQGTFVPPGGLIFSGPTWPSTAAPDYFSLLQCTMRWGAGGVSFITQFDYPATGGVFGVTADTIDINVDVKGSTNVQTFMQPDNVPVVGAFMVEGVAADPTPLRWQENRGLVPVGGIGAHFYTVKPFARKVRIVAPFDSLTGGGGGNQLYIQWMALVGPGPGLGNVSTTVLVDTETAGLGGGINAVLDVPQGAQLMLMNVLNGVQTNVFVEWYIGFS